MLLRPLSVILDDVRPDKRDRTATHRPLLEAPVVNTVNYPDVYWRNSFNWSLKYSNVPKTSETCDVISRNAPLADLYRGTKREQPLKRTWDNAFNIPRLPGFSPVEVVLYLETCSLLRQCLALQHLLDSAPKAEQVVGVGSDTSSVVFSDRIDGASDSSGDTQSLGDSPRPTVASMPLSGSSTHRAFLSSPFTPSSSSTAVPRFPEYFSSHGHLVPSLRHSREQNDDPMFDSRDSTGWRPMMPAPPMPQDGTSTQRQDIPVIPDAKRPAHEPSQTQGASYTQMAVDTRVIPPGTEATATAHVLPPSSARGSTPASVATGTPPVRSPASSPPPPSPPSPPSPSSSNKDGADDGWVLC